MSREWSAVYSAMLTKPRYRRLTPMGRGALLHVILLAGYESPEATWDNPDELRDALRLDGFPEGVFDELMGLQWLVMEDRVLVLRDWDKHQRAASKEARNVWEAARKKEWRRKNRLGSAEAPSPAPPTRRREERRGEGSRTRADMSGTTPPIPLDFYEGNLYEVYSRLTGHPCDEKAQSWIDDLVKGTDRMAVRRAMYADSQPKSGNLLGRVTTSLRKVS